MCELDITTGSSHPAPLLPLLQPRIVLHYLGLSTLYTINNQLSFYCLEVADPGSMALGKSVRARRVNVVAARSAVHMLRCISFLLET